MGGVITPTETSAAMSNHILITRLMKHLNLTSGSTTSHTTGDNVLYRVRVLCGKLSVYSSFTDTLSMVHYTFSPSSHSLILSYPLG